MAYPSGPVGYSTLAPAATALFLYSGAGYHFHGATGTEFV